MYYCVSVPLFGVISKILEDLRKAIGIERFPPPKLGLSLKFKEKAAKKEAPSMFPSPKLGLSLKSLRVTMFALAVAGFRPLILGYI